MPSDRRIEWKPFYRSELAGSPGREAVTRAVAARLGSGPEPDLVAALQAGGALSFPHTTIVASAEPLARVAHALACGGFERVAALGVFHGGMLAEPERSEH